MSALPGSVAVSGLTLTAPGVVLAAAPGGVPVARAQSPTPPKAAAFARETPPENAIDAQEHAANVARSLWVLSLGTALWTLFSLNDLAVTLYVAPVPLSRFWLPRGIEIVVLLVAIGRLRRRPMISPFGLRIMDFAVYGLANVLVALMCLPYRGLESPYLSGAGAVLIAQGLTQPENYRRGAIRLGVTATLVPATMLIGSLWTPAVRAQLASPSSVVVFVEAVLLLYASTALLVVGGHAFWVLRRRVFEAKQIGKYRLRRRIGQGGMGEVWQAYHPSLKRDVAIKILRADRLDAAMTARFEREILATTGLCHPNTVRVFDCGVTDDGFWYYTMELLTGETLQDLVARQGALPEERAVHIVRQAARALVEAHGRGIVHRDIKPDNLFIAAVDGEPDFVKLLDFGIAQVAAQGADAGITREGALVGTPLYMSPEQARGAEVDARSDLYALGAVLYFALSGRPPFDGEAMKVLVSHITSSPRPLAEVAPRPVSEAVGAVVLRCLAKRPEERFASAKELDAALDALGLPPPSLTARPPAPMPRPPVALHASELETPLAPTLASVNRS